MNLQHFKQAKLLRDKCISGEKPLFFIVTSGRSGSNLLASMLDQHPEILLFPVPWFCYVDDERAMREKQDPFDWSLKKGTLSRCWYHDGLGPLGRESFDIPRARLYSIYCQLLENWNSRNRNDQILAGLLAWGIYSKQNLDNINALMIHHHPVICDYAIKSLVPAFDYNFQEEGMLWNRVCADFPNFKMIWTYRHPLEMFASIYRALEREKIPIDLSRWFMQIWGLLHMISSGLEQEKKLGKNFLRIDFLKMHNDWEKCKESLVNFLTVKQDPVLDYSTVNGLSWPGNNPERRREGPQPGLVDDEWEKLPEELRAYSYTLLAHLFTEDDTAKKHHLPQAESLKLITEAYNWAQNTRFNRPARLINLPSKFHNSFLNNFLKNEDLLLKTWVPDNINIPRTKFSNQNTKSKHNLIALPFNWKPSALLSTIPQYEELWITRDTFPPEPRLLQGENRAFLNLNTLLLYSGLTNKPASIRFNPYHYDRDRCLIIVNQKKVTIIGLDDTESKEWQELCDLCKVPYLIKRI